MSHKLINGESASACTREFRTQWSRRPWPKMICSETPHGYTSKRVLTAEMGFGEDIHNRPWPSPNGGTRGAQRVLIQVYFV